MGLIILTDKKFIIFGLLTLLIIGSISIFVVKAETQEKGESHWFGKSLRGHWKGRERGFDNKTSFSNDLKEKLGLPEDATEEEVKEAIKQRRETHREEWKKRVKEKLGLPESASDEELREAMKKWRDENKDPLRGFGHRKHGFDKRGG